MLPHMLVLQPPKNALNVNADMVELNSRIVTVSLIIISVWFRRLAVRQSILLLSRLARLRKNQGTDVDQKGYKLLVGAAVWTLECDHD